ncbi:virulence factor TspB C-terminal domain-related protein [Aeromonas sp. sif2433]|uniref:virulence factor TspB C-terminal domain-related protein n=1 Tax=Aeromonas sp. sif2433 TaxID=2854794 RepID=UPI001C43E433|nr:virulence factor TspB C-terminal domain-related protein [Aeromonas sp. sif2433]MBV7415131.1 hypothetical protein [Aeromonas sp. sif2433]MBV7415139.1 hypothetical protein [Aeromonas sp. sif2433]
MKYLIFLVTLSFSFISSAAYTDMVIEGVKQSNGVWTTAGVMDTQGFVRTTAQVSVYGTTKNLPVAMAADTAAAGAMLRGAARLAGPVALAAAAYDVYQWATATDIKPCDVSFCIGTPTVVVPDEMDSLGCNYVDTGNNIRTHLAPLAYSACMQMSYNNIKTYMMGPGYTFNYLNVSGATPKPGYTDPSRDMLFDTTFTGRATHTNGYVYNYSRTVTYVVRPPSSPFTYSNPTATDADFNKLPNPPIPLIISGWTKIPSLIGQPTPIKSTDFTPFSEWMSDPYFKDGNWWRDRMDVSPAPLPGQPTRVRIDIGPVKLEGMTDPTVKPDDTPANNSTAPKEQTKFCDDNPMSIACAEMGELEEEELETKEIPVNTSYSPWGSSNSNCPQPRVVNIFDGKSFSISYQPTCDFVTMLRPLLIGLALVAAAYIIGGFGRSGGGE